MSMTSFNSCFCRLYEEGEKMERVRSEIEREGAVKKLLEEESFHLDFGENVWFTTNSTGYFIVVSS